MSGWSGMVECEMPDGCVPCRLCGGNCAGAEAIEEDWYGRGRVIRIWSECKESDSYEKDDIRTEFAPEKEAVAEWNEMQRKDL